MNHWVMDYETLSNCFVAVFEDYQDENEQRIFVVHDLRNDFDAFVEFLKQNITLKERHISYNGLAFDAQITEYILRHSKQWSKLPPQRIAQEIYGKAQDTIERSNKREWLEFYESKMKIPQLDVFKLNHWDNPAKRSSLKWIQFSMDWPNLQDMPIHHTQAISTQEEIDDIIHYCINDVQSTKRILHLSKGQVNLRNTLTKEYGINLYSASEPRISKELFLHFLSEKTGQDKKEIKYSRTKRDEIVVKDIILPYIEFKNPKFQELLDKFNDTIIDPLYTKGSLKHSIKDNGVKIDFGLGGVHGCREAGIYTSENGMITMSSDVVSYYPRLGMVNLWSPAHLDKTAFTEQYQWFFDERRKIPKSDPRNYVYKIILNSTYGLSNDKHSFLYDPQFTMQITINGQLSLMMLYEMIMEEIPGAIPLMQNTDGLETMIPAEYKDKYIEICNRWEKITQLELEHDEYQKLILADVNNYIAIYKDGKTKCKGRFEFDNLALHKNKSHLIVPKALYEYFVNDIPPEVYLASNNNIFDYCIGKKIKGNWKFVEKFIDADREFVEKDVQPTIRYYITKKGSKVYKINKGDGRAIKVESGPWLLTIFNEYKEMEWQDYGVEDKYYLQMIYREIENIAGSKLKQLTLFE